MRVLHARHRGVAARAAARRRQGALHRRREVRPERPPVPLHRLPLAQGLRRHAAARAGRCARRGRGRPDCGAGGSRRHPGVLHHHPGAAAGAVAGRGCGRERGCGRRRGRRRAGGAHRRRHRPVRAAGRGAARPPRRSAGAEPRPQGRPPRRRRVPHRRAHHLRGVGRRPGGDRRASPHRRVQSSDRLLADPQPRHAGRQHRQRLPDRRLHRPAAGVGRDRGADRRRPPPLRPAPGVLPRLQRDRPAARRAAHRGGVPGPGRRAGQLREGLQAHLPRHRLRQQRLLDPLRPR